MRLPVRSPSSDTSVLALCTFGCLLNPAAERGLFWQIDNKRFGVGVDTGLEQVGLRQPEQVLTYRLEGEHPPPPGAGLSGGPGQRSRYDEVKDAGQRQELDADNGDSRTYQEIGDGESEEHSKCPIGLEDFGFVHALTELGDAGVVAKGSQQLRKCKQRDTYDEAGDDPA